MLTQRETQMSNSVETACSRAIRRDRSTVARRRARGKKADRERQIVNLLNSGISVAEIAQSQGVTHRRMRMIVAEILARRAPQPPAEFLAVQISRLSEALLVSYSAMGGGNLEAVDRVVKIVRELDRYHGLAAIERSERSDERRLPSPPPLALAAPNLSQDLRKEMAPQHIDLPTFAEADQDVTLYTPTARGRLP